MPVTKRYADFDMSLSRRAASPFSARSRSQAPNKASGAAAPFEKAECGKGQQCAFTQ
jgi:hypothetical protein